MTKGNSKQSESFTQTYKESVYATWQLHDKPALNSLIDLIDPDDRGRKPNIATISRWKTEESWEERDAEIQIRVQENTDRELVKIRMDMMKRHAERAREVSDMSMKYLQDVGFDSSASAVTALFKAIAEEKNSTGMGIALAQIFSLSDSDLSKKVNALLARANGIELDGEDVVNAEMEESDYAPGNEETTNS